MLCAMSWAHTFFAVATTHNCGGGPVCASHLAMFSKILLYVVGMIGDALVA